MRKNEECFESVEKKEGLFGRRNAQTVGTQGRKGDDMKKRNGKGWKKEGRG